MDWCVADLYGKANHNPVAVLAGDSSKAVVQVVVKPGQTVSLDASGTYDPDGDEVSSHWFAYNEAGTYRGPIEIQDAEGALARVTIPKGSAGKTIHIILEVKDDGEPSLFSYRRVILNVRS